MFRLVSFVSLILFGVVNTACANPVAVPNSEPLITTRQLFFGGLSMATMITLGGLIISLILIGNADGEKIKNKVLCFATWFLFFCNFLICSYGFFVPTVKIHVDTLALISLISVLVELFFLRISIKIKERNEYNLIFEKTSMIFISIVYILFFILWFYIKLSM